MSDKPDWAAAVTAEANNNAFTPLATGDDDATVTNTNNMGAAQTLATGFANRLTRAATLDAVAWTIPIAVAMVPMVTKTDAETGTTDMNAAANICIGSRAGCGECAQSNGTGDKN